MLKKSMHNPEPPHVADAKGGKKGMPSQPPQAKARSGNSSAGGPIVTEIKGSGRGNRSFTAPRSAASQSDIERGFTKVGS